MASLRIKRRPEALGHQKLSRASKFSFQASKFSSFSYSKIFNDEFRAGKFWNLNALKTAWRFRTVTPVWIHQWLRNDAQSLK